MSSLGNAYYLKIVNVYSIIFYFSEKKYLGGYRG